VPSSIRVDLGEQLALAVAGTQLDGAVGLARCAIGQIGLGVVFLLEMIERRIGVLDDVALPFQQPLAEEFTHHRIHECFLIVRIVIRREKRR
jgi:hypothetical protein